MSPLGFLLVAIALAFLWFGLMRPQRRRQQQQQQMWDSLESGDEVVTAGGIYGEVTGIQGDDVVVRIAPELEVRVARRAIAGVIQDSLQDGLEDEFGDDSADEPADESNEQPADTNGEEHAREPGNDEQGRYPGEPQ